MLGSLRFLLPATPLAMPNNPRKPRGFMLQIARQRRVMEQDDIQQTLLQVQVEGMMDMGGSVVPKQDCPHVLSRVVVTPDQLALSMNRPCEECASGDESWVCLGCNATRCSRYVNGHMEEHWMATLTTDTDAEGPQGHCMALSLSDLSVWCYVCNSYVKHDSLMPLLVRAESVKFGCEEKGGLLEGCQSVFRTAIAYDPLTEAHERTNPPCFERPARTRSVWERLMEVGLIAKARAITVHPATDQQLMLVHSAEHVASLGALAHPQVRASLPKDLFASEGTPEAVRRSAGSGLAIVQAMANGHVDFGLALARPPGHHAGRSYMGGFCFVNNVAIAAKQAKQLIPGVERVLILDWDIHHGNGTQDIFYEDPTVLVVNLHRQIRSMSMGPTESPAAQAHTQGEDDAHSVCFEAGARADRVGEGAGRGYNVNVAFHSERGVGDGAFMAAMRLVVGPIAESFRPHMVIVSAGFDACVCDAHLAVGGYRVSPLAFAHMTHMAMAWTQTQTQTQPQGGKVLLCLEGGYQLSGLADCVEACFRVLLGCEGAPPPLPPDADMECPISPESQADIDATIHALSPFWPSLGQHTRQ